MYTAESLNLCFHWAINLATNDKFYFNGWCQTKYLHFFNWLRQHPYSIFYRISCIFNVMLQLRFVKRNQVRPSLPLSVSYYYHDDVIKWKHFPRYWPFVWRIHRSPVNSPQKASDAELWYFLWSAPWINGWVNNREAGDLRRHRAHYDVIVVDCVEIKYIVMYLLILLGGAISHHTQLFGSFVKYYF